MFEKEKEIFDNDLNFNVLLSYPGYNIQTIIEYLKVKPASYILIDFKNSFYTLDYFYKFKIVNIFNKFIRTNQKITTIGQLYNYLKKLNFDSEILENMNRLNSLEYNKNDKFLIAWNIIIRLYKKIGIRKIIFSDLDAWWEGRRNQKKEYLKIIDFLFIKLKENSINTIFELKSMENFRKSLENVKKTEVFFSDLKSEFDEKCFNRYFGEIDLCFLKPSEHIEKYIVKNRVEKYLSTCRGGNQLKYILFIISFAGENGFNITEIAKNLEISAGAAGSSVKRLYDSGLLKCSGKKYSIKNNAFREYIMENGL